MNLPNYAQLLTQASSLDARTVDVVTVPVSLYQDLLLRACAPGAPSVEVSFEDWRQQPLNERPKNPTPVQRHHRLAVLRVHGYSEQWLAERSQHLANRWLERGQAADLATTGAEARWDALGQELADMEARGAQDRVAIAEGLRRVLDRIDRAIADELGQADQPRWLPSEKPLDFPRGIAGAVNDVWSFHDACDVPCLDEPQWPGDERAQLRAALIEEERSELMAALHCAVSPGNEWNPATAQLNERDPKGQLCAIAREIVDLIYILVGTALEFGIPLGRVWAVVHRANMAKLGPDGKALKRADGKVIKPDGWLPPDVESAVFGAFAPQPESIKP